MKAGSCPPAAQTPTCIGHIETWAVTPATGNTSREGVSDLGVRLPTSLLMLMVDAVEAN